MALALITCVLCERKITPEYRLEHIREHGFRYNTLENWMY